MSGEFIPYGRQIIEDDDVAAVIGVLRGDWLTTGPTVVTFEEEFAAFVEAPHAVAVSSGTAALHLSALAADLGPGDEVIVPALTFVASANAARYVGATVVFADVDPDTWLIDVDAVRGLITDRTRAIVGVDYAGAPCDWPALRELADTHGLVLIEDAAHAPGATIDARPVGSIADFTCFSFHPVKHLTTAEGGMVTTTTAERAARLKSLRGHGIANDFRARESEGTWEYDQRELGYNYRLPDTACALGLSQLHKQPEWLDRRRQIAKRYDEAFAGMPEVQTQVVPDGRVSAWHLYPVRITTPDASKARARVFARMRDAGIGVNVHYRPVYLNSYYRDLGYPEGLCPQAEAVYSGLLSLPMWPGLTEAQQDHVVATLSAALRG
ncbi:UDP-4-amino-4,6-dideoxy-N-acetyl-beta-L-altrosamine transaminase [Nostocoides sp. F2B08]|uniref:UDP-4-amino-4, 6-dideoxy-N-acetyl-beta-L-altrosamine transaminase n=1 Tax=Nostocoides sp. F2B08 TaxID=2653936 RepID=UPI00126308EB|nr:UDP-4-amino-4,6-dideoxy-N-acetyl-beta-L-altrosamine transaminase [Tetrasphaera sp. F2B08]KAB7741930.1 UDP-4-amino-4,6-dideoxy-N-acetyl-beta-L-altrosamine transaminase [Tetrasphaera sp. F2B08]